MRKILAGVWFCCFLIYAYGGLALHFWTVYIGLANFGWKVGLLTLATPVISEIWWFKKSWGLYGLFGTYYSLACMLWLFCFVFGVIGMMFEEPSRSIKQRRESDV